MQKFATRLFICASFAFGVIGILIVLTMPGPNQPDNSSSGHILLMKLLFTCVFIILPSFALSVASKYLNGKS